jgi:hypothetical protein
MQEAIITTSASMLGSWLVRCADVGEVKWELLGPHDEICRSVWKRELMGVNLGAGYGRLTGIVGLVCKALYLCALDNCHCACTGWISLMFLVAP